MAPRRQTDSSPLSLKKRVCGFLLDVGLLGIPGVFAAFLLKDSSGAGSGEGDEHGWVAVSRVGVLPLGCAAIELAEQ